MVKNSFESFELESFIMKNIQKMKQKLPTPIQRKAIPHALVQKDIVAMAKTGSGKTLAFLIPMLQKLKSHSTQIGARGLVLSPTRDLAIQTFKQLQKLARGSDLVIALIVGGQSIERQQEMISRNPDIIIGTPGRVIHHIVELDEKFSMKRVQCLVFDEADRLIEEGFMPQMQEIVKKCQNSLNGRQTLLFSATMPSVLSEFVKIGLMNPVMVQINKEFELSENLLNVSLLCSFDQKYLCLIELINKIIDSKLNINLKKDKKNKKDLVKDSNNQIIIFFCTKYHVEQFSELYTKQCRSYRQNEVSHVMLHGKMDTELKNTNISNFKNRKALIMFTTDLAARGLDYYNMRQVINFDLPADPKLQVHRAGRTARLENEGVCFSIVTINEQGQLNKIASCSEKGLSNSSKWVKLQLMNQSHKDDKDGIEESIFESKKFFQVSRQSPDRALIKLQKILSDDDDISLLFEQSEKAYQNQFKNRKKPTKIDYSTFIRQINANKPFDIEFYLKEIASNDTIDFKESIRNYKPKVTKMEFEVISKMKKTDGTNQMQVIKDFKDKIIRHGDRIARLQARVDSLYGDQADDTLTQTNDEKPQINQSEFFQKLEFQTPFLKRKRSKISNIKEKDETKEETKLDFQKARNEFHKSLNLSKDNLEFEMLYEDPNDTSHKSKGKQAQDEKTKKFGTVKDKKMWFNESGVKVLAGDKFGRYKKWSSDSKTKISKVFEREGANASTEGRTRGGLKTRDELVKQKKGEMKNKIRHERVSKSKERKQKKAKKARTNRHKNKK